MCEGEGKESGGLTFEVDGPRFVGINVVDHVLEFFVGRVEPEFAHDAAELGRRDLAVAVAVLFSVVWVSGDLIVGLFIPSPPVHPRCLCDPRSKRISTRCTARTP